MIPLFFGDMKGLQFRRVRPGRDLVKPALPIAWIVIIDDRALGASGPTSFHADTLRWLFADEHDTLVWGIGQIVHGQAGEADGIAGARYAKGDVDVTPSTLPSVRRKASTRWRSISS